MQSTLRVIASHQTSFGYFPTRVINENEGISRVVHTITPTYLVCLILDELRESGLSHHLLDSIIDKGVNFLSRMCYTDPVMGFKVWHFNAFYAPDWEETAWSTYLLYKQGLLTRKDLEPLRKLAQANETHDRGVGVWLKDDYSAGNHYDNVFDPVVSLSVSQFLQRVFGERSEPTENFIARAIESSKPSLYYADGFQEFFFFLFGKGRRPTSLKRDASHLFHHGNRKDVWYESSDVWEAAELAMAV